MGKPAKIVTTEGKEMSQANQVIITIRGGVAELASKPANIEVILRDYDVQGIEEERLQRDADGDRYIECVHPVDEK